MTTQAKPAAPPPAAKTADPRATIGRGDDSAHFMAGAHHQQAAHLHRAASMYHEAGEHARGKACAREAYRHSAMGHALSEKAREQSSGMDDGDEDDEEK